MVSGHCGSSLVVKLRSVDFPDCRCRQTAFELINCENLEIPRFRPGSTISVSQHRNHSLTN